MTSIAPIPPLAGLTVHARAPLRVRSRRGIAAIACAILVGCARHEAPDPAPIASAPEADPPGYVGGDACASCHPAEAAAYRTSDHARAMQVASRATLPADFAGKGLAHGPAAATFSYDGDAPRVRMADGHRGVLDLPVAYTFGVDPLLQLLVPGERGAFQALPVAWDARARERGGQRWFDVNEGRVRDASDPLHWSGLEQRWNHQCADCHSTNLRKRYSLPDDAYDTQWAELAVSCEACHGPGSRHVAWAEDRASAAPASASAAGLVVDLRPARGEWTMTDAARGIATWSGDPRGHGEVDACARCHARRRQIVDPTPSGEPFLDTHVPALLEEDLYFADGQIRGEVFEWGSFVQSRMYRAGVTCSDCHDSHSGGLRADGNATCARCHLASRFDAPAHHHHAPDSAGARCVSCHMPSRTYMVVDPRRDHSLRVPRPDLTVAIGTPNPCEGCHAERGARWAADAVAAWAPENPQRPQFATALHSGRSGLADAERALATLAVDATQPAMARASALAMLPPYLSARSAPAIAACVRDDEPLMRMAGATAAWALPPEARTPLVLPLLRDRLRAVRIAAAGALADVPREGWRPADRAAFDGALGELVASELCVAERPEAHLNLGSLRARLGERDAAHSELAQALRLSPRFVPALVNEADLLRGEGRDDEAEARLAEALRLEPKEPTALHALGLLRVRQGRRDEALDLLGRAAAAAPDDARLALVHAVAVADSGDVRAAVRLLVKAHERRPAERALLSALVAYEREVGDVQAARRHAAELAALSSPSIPARP